MDSGATFAPPPLDFPSGLRSLFTGADAPSAGARFGHSVDIASSSPRRVVIGAPFHLEGTASIGTVYVFDSSNSWDFSERISPFDGNDGDLFGFAVYLSRNPHRVVIGAPRNGASGSVYSFTFSSPATFEQKLKASDPQTDGLFGTSVALSGNQLLVGSPGASDSAVKSGLAYLFERNSPWSQRTIIRPTSLIEGGQFGRSVSLATSVALVGEPAAGTGKATVYSVLTIVIQNVIGQLDSIIDANQGTPLADKMEDAEAKTQVALEELTKTPPDLQAALGNLEAVVGELEAAVKDGLLDPLQGNELMDQLTEIARVLAVEAIDEAIAQGGDAGEIADAQQALADGDALRNSGAFKDAINKYKDALAKAESALS